MPIWCIQTSSYVTAWELLYHHFLAIHNIHARQEFARHFAPLHVIDACTFGLCQFRWLLDARWAVASFAHMTAGGILYPAPVWVLKRTATISIWLRSVITLYLLMLSKVVVCRFTSLALYSPVKEFSIPLCIPFDSMAT